MEISVNRYRSRPSNMCHSRINVAHVLLLLLVIGSSVEAMVPPLVRPNVSLSSSSSITEDNLNSADLTGDTGLQKKKQSVQAIVEYPQCEWIPVTVCQGLGYNMTAMPNLIGHTNLLDAEIMIKSLSTILESSAQARFLLCATLFPLCSPDVSRPVPPCRDLCETVKVNHTVELEFLNCNALPQPDKLELCVQTPNPETDAFNYHHHHQSQQPLQNQPHLNQRNEASDAHHQKTWAWLNWKLPTNQKVSSVTTCPINFTLFFDECVPQCRTDALYSSHQKKITETWILILAVTCFLSTLISLVTFWTETSRFGFPERPVLFLTLCYNLLSICYLERIIFHNRNLEIYEFDEVVSIGACEVNPPCLANFITTSYLMLSAASWWLIFGLCWYLSAAKQWSSEALEMKAGLFHVLAWVPPLVPPVAALLFGAVKPNELTGLCSAPGYTEIPTLILLVTGGIFIVLAARSLKKLQFSCNNGKLYQMTNRILHFGLIYFLPAVIAMCLMLLESKLNVTKKVKPCQPGDVCQPPEKLKISLSLAKLFFILFGGALTGIWVWSRKTCKSCRSRMVFGGSAEGYPNNYHVTEDGQYVTTRQSLLNGTMAINIQNSQLVHQLPSRTQTLSNGQYIRTGGNIVAGKGAVASKFGSKSSNYFLGSPVPITANRNRPNYNYSLAPTQNLSTTLFPGIHFQQNRNMNSSPATAALRS